MKRRLLHKKTWRHIALGLLIGLFVVQADLRADSVGEAPRVVARAYGEVPPDATIFVEIPDESDVNIWVRDTMISNLERLGYTVAEDAPFIMKLDGKVRNDTTEGSRFSLEGESGISRFNTLQLNYKVPFGEGKSQPNQTSVTITASVSKPGSRPIWQGTASATALHRHAIDVQPARVAALADAVGKTVGGSN